MTQKCDENVLRAFGCYYYFSSFALFCILFISDSSRCEAALPVTPQLRTLIVVWWRDGEAARLANCQQKQRSRNGNKIPRNKQKINKNIFRLGGQNRHERLACVCVISCDIKSFPSCHSSTLSLRHTELKRRLLNNSLLLSGRTLKVLKVYKYCICIYLCVWNLNCGPPEKKTGFLNACNVHYLSSLFFSPLQLK